MGRWPLAALLLVVGCTSPSRLVVQLVTDYAPEREFDRIEVTLTPEDGAPHTEQIGLARGGYGRPSRLLEHQVEGAIRVDVTLLFDGHPIATAHRRTTAIGTSVTTLLVERACADVSCDEDQACFSAMCVEDTCTPEHPEACPASVCEVDLDCGTANGCIVPRCQGGACLALPDDSLCGPTERCDPLGGCVDDAPACTDPEPFGTPELVMELPGVHASAPTLTADELRIVFEGGEFGEFRIYEATRASRQDPFGAPTIIVEPDDPSGELYDPMLRCDGLEIGYMPNDLSDYGCIVRMTRASLEAPFVDREPIDALCDSDPPSAFYARDYRSVYAVAEASSPRPLRVHRRTALDAPFGPETALGTLEGRTPSLTSDGLTVFFEAGNDGTGDENDLDVWVAHRSSRDAAFAPGAAVPELATPVADGDPEISADGRSIYFFSRRPDGGNRRLYVAHRRCAGDE